jgi:uncharacterized protein
MPADPAGLPDLSAVPLFPLPNVVLFPRAVLPLHIFEHRYRLMTADAVAGNKLVAMALLRPGWERDYHGRPAIEPAVCVGEILSWEELEDGKYNFLLRGVARATIVREFIDRPYRYAELAPIQDASRVLEIDLSPEREKLATLFSSPPLGATPLGQYARAWLSSPISTSDVADLIAFHLIEATKEKQALLEEADTRRRVRRVIKNFESMVEREELFSGGRSAWN